MHDKQSWLKYIVNYFSSYKGIQEVIFCGYIYICMLYMWHVAYSTSPTFPQGQLLYNYKIQTI